MIFHPRKSTPTSLNEDDHNISLRGISTHLSCFAIAYPGTSCLILITIIVISIIIYNWYKFKLFRPPAPHSIFLSILYVHDMTWHNFYYFYLKNFVIECLSVRLYPINVKTANSIFENFENTLFFKNPRNFCFCIFLPRRTLMYFI